MELHEGIPVPLLGRILFLKIKKYKRKIPGISERPQTTPWSITLLLMPLKERKDIMKKRYKFTLTASLLSSR